MNGELSLAEITRWLQKHDATHERYVPRELFDLIVGQMRADVEEIKESNRWMLRLVVSNLVGFLVYILVNLVRNAPS